MFSIYRDQAAMVPLKDTWEQASEALRESILQASGRLDQQLQHDPQAQGESRDDKTRILFQAPLGVTFAVDEAKKLVYIVRAWAYRCGAAGEAAW